LNKLFTYQNIILSQPLWLLLLFIIPVIIFLLNRKKNTDALLLSHGLAKNNFKKPTKVIVLQAINTFPYIALASLIIAMARPQEGNSLEQTTGSGVDIILCMDISGSMLAEDFQPNRLEASKEVAEKFVSNRPYDRMGLVIFSGESFTQCSLTTDANILINQISNLRCGLLSDGTAIGKGLATSVDKLRNGKAKSKVIILLTDGVNNAPDGIGPETALEIAKAYNVKVYTIGVGANGEANMPVGKTAFGEWVYEKTKVEIDEVLLTKIAKETGASYYRCTDNLSLQNVYAQIDKLEKSDITIKKIDKRKELFYPFVLLGGILLLVFFVLKHSWLKGIV
jgi:Ca-activated chloride channel homolog